MNDTHFSTSEPSLTRLSRIGANLRTLWPQWVTVCLFIIALVHLLAAPSPSAVIIVVGAAVLMLMTFGYLFFMQRQSVAGMAVVVWAGGFAMALLAVIISPNLLPISVLCVIGSVSYALALSDRQAMRVGSVAAWVFLAVVMAVGELIRAGMLNFGFDFAPQTLRVVLLVAALGIAADVIQRLWRHFNRIETTLANLKASNHTLEQTRQELERRVVETTRLKDDAVKTAALGERNRLARELHDSVSQALFGVSLGVRTSLQAMTTQPDKARPAMEYSLTLAEAALAEMRALIFELHPDMLQEEGLLAAMQKQAAFILARHQLQLDVSLCPDEPEMAIEAKEALYRIGTEAMQNVIRHAKAGRAELTLQNGGGWVTLSVCDDGLGFDMHSRSQGHLGLKTMRERAEKFGGRFEIDSAPGQGTTVQVSMPVAGK